MFSVPLAKDEIRTVRGPTVYLIHFERPFRHAAHYLGYTTNVIARIAQHRAGRGARLLEVIGEYGIGFEVARIWPGDRRLERRLKNWHSGPRLCPICQARRRAKRHQLRLFSCGCCRAHTQNTARPRRRQKEHVMLAAMPLRNLKTVTTPMHELHDRLHTLLHATPAADAPLAAQPLTEQVKVFERIEAGKLDRHRADPAFVREIEQAVDQLVAVFYTPLDGRPFIVPRDAWTHSPLMKLLASVTYWLYQDDLISMADAARIVYGASDDALLSRIRRMIERGQLHHYWLPGREAKQRSYLVRRSEVEQVQQQQGED